MPASRPYTVAPRARANSSRSSTMIPEPSPSTKPSRSTSNGREARSGSSLRVLMARIWENPAIGMLGDARLRAAGDDDVRLARLDHPPAPGQRLGAGRARRHRRVHAGLGAQLQADVRGRAVRHEHRDGQRRDLAQALLLQDVVLAEQGQRAADAGADDHGEPQRVHRAAVLAASAESACAHASRAATIATCSQRSRRRASTRLSTSVGSTASCAAIFTGRSNRVDPLGVQPRHP